LLPVLRAMAVDRDVAISVWLVLRDGVAVNRKE